MASNATFSIFRRPPGSAAGAGPARLDATSPPPPAPPPPAPEPAPEPEPIRPVGPDTAALEAVDLFSDQLALTSPGDVAVRAGIGGADSVALSADAAGLYRPRDFRPAPWSGFAYDYAGNARAGVVAGTRLLTAAGEQVVERLMPGEVAMVLKSPALRPIGWIGRSTAADGIVVIEPGALGPDTPRRQLGVGPDQALFVTKSPVQAHTLVNGTTIRLAADAAADLFHVDVGQAEILFAEGVALASTSRVLPAA